MFSLILQKNQPKTGFHPLPPNFTLAQPETKPMMADQRQEAPFQPRSDFEMKKPKSYNEEYASNYPPPYQAATKEPPAPEEKEDDGDADWL